MLRNHPYLINLVILVAAFVFSIALTIITERYIAVHGCFLNDRFYYGYVTGSMVEQNLFALATRADWPLLGLCGHTHQPMVAWLEGEFVRESFGTESRRWPAGARSVIVNPGAVGQPRDRDPRSSYAIVDFSRREVHFERVAYEIDTTARSMRNAGLSEDLISRLYRGV